MSYCIPIWLLALCLGQAGEPTQTQAFASARAARIDGISYHLSLVLHERETYTGRVKIRFDLNDTSKDLAIDFSGEEVLSFHVNDRKIKDFSLSHGRINLPAHYLKKGLTELIIEFRTRTSPNGTGFRRFVDPADGLIYLFTDLEPYRAHAFFPCFDQPNLKAVLHLEVHAPASWSLVSNEPIRQQRREGTRQHVFFQPTRPLPTYLFQLVAGNYAEIRHEGFRIPMAIYCRQSQRNRVKAEDIFSEAQAGLKFFESWFHSPYPFTKYDHVFAPGFLWGGMENPGAVLISERFLGASSRAKTQRRLVILHEMAHMWVGNKITQTWWDDLWIGESIADYAMSGAITKMGDKETWRYHEGMVELAKVRDTRQSTHPVFAQAHDTKAARSLFDSITYGKGYMVLGQLVALIGEENFREGMRLLIERFAWGNVDRGRFLSAMEQASGRSLADWKQQWLASPSINRLHLQYEVRDGLIHSAVLNQERDQAKTLRNHKLVLGLFSAADSGPVTCNETIPVDIKKATRTLSGLVGKAAPVFILPDPYGQAYVRVRLDHRSLEWIRAHFQRISEPQFRNRVWRILWDMVGSGDLSARDLLDMGLAHAAAEEDPMLLDRILGDLETIVNEFIADEQAIEKHANRLFDLALDEVLGALPGSFQRRAWFTTLFAVARTMDQLDQLYRFYDCRNTPGFDLEQKWRFCAKLIGLGPLANHLVADLSKQDKSERGRDFLHYFKVLEPEAAAKQAAWKSLTEEKMSRKRWKLLASGFHDKEYPELTRPFIKPFFTQLGQIYREEGWLSANQFCHALFPMREPERVIPEAQTFLATEEDHTLRTLIQVFLERLEHRNVIRERERSSFKLQTPIFKGVPHPR